MAKKENTDRWFICISRLWVVAFVAFPLLWSACSGPKNEVVKGFEDAAEVPTLRTLDFGFGCDEVSYQCSRMVDV